MAAAPSAPRQVGCASRCPQARTHRLQPVHKDAHDAHGHAALGAAALNQQHEQADEDGAQQQGHGPVGGVRPALEALLANQRVAGQALGTQLRVRKAAGGAAVRIRAEHQARRTPRRTRCSGNPSPRTAPVWEPTHSNVPLEPQSHTSWNGHSCNRLAAVIICSVTATGYRVKQASGTEVGRVAAIGSGAPCPGLRSRIRPGVAECRQRRTRRGPGKQCMKRRFPRCMYREDTAGTLWRMETARRCLRPPVHGDPTESCGW